MLAPKKSLGQHFLHDENVVRKILDRLAVHADDALVEIGPGSGILTRQLVGRSASMVGIEIDASAVAALNEQFGPSLEILHQDVLDTELAVLAKKYRKQLRIVGNIPYYITSQILFWMFDQHESIHDALLMVQLEVAKRLTALPKTKDYGILTVSTQFYTSAELLFRVSRNSFYPRPTVDSAVVAFHFKPSLPDCDRRLFQNILRCTFGKRRKTLRNGLRSMGFTDSQLQDLPVGILKRPEQLTVDDFVALTKALERYRETITLKY